MDSSIDFTVFGIITPELMDLEPPASSIHNVPNDRAKLKEVLQHVQALKNAVIRFEEVSELQASIISAQNELVQS